jgi:5-formyltetrahydrofolate cyclo-ligase
VDALADLEERGMMFREPLRRPRRRRPRSTSSWCLRSRSTRRGHRIGYGAGFYDKALPRFAPPARTIIVAFDFQLIPEVPVTEGDVTLDLVITDERALDPRADGAK